MLRKSRFDSLLRKSPIGLLAVLTGPKASRSSDVRASSAGWTLTIWSNLNALMGTLNPIRSCPPYSAGPQVLKHVYIPQVLKHVKSILANWLPSTRNIESLLLWSKLLLFSVRFYAASVCLAQWVIWSCSYKVTKTALVGCTVQRSNVFVDDFSIPVTGHTAAKVRLLNEVSRLISLAHLFYGLIVYQF